MTLRNLTFQTSSTSAHAFERECETGATALDETARLYETRVDEWPSFSRELFARLYRPADEKRPLDPDDASAWASATHRAVETQGDWPELRTLAQAHRTIAARATGTIARAVGKQLGLEGMPPDPVKAKDPAELHRQAAALRRAAEAAGRAAGPGMVEDADLADAAMEVSAAGAAASNRRASLVRAAGKLDPAAAVAAAVVEARKVAEGIGLLRGWGLGSDEPGGDDGDVSAELLALVMGDARLRKILEMIGRMRESYAAKGAAKEARGHEDLVGIETGDNPMRLVPQEVARLGHPILAGELYARLLDKGAQVWKLRGKVRKNQGDVRIVVDRSGSMGDDRIVWARAVGAAAMLMALRDRRRVTLSLFSDSVESVDVQPGKPADLAAALRLLAGGVRGGTNADRALLSATATASRGRGQPDILIVTDGDFPVPGDVGGPESQHARVAVNKWRKDGGRIVVVGIGINRHDAASHAVWSDEQHAVSALSAERGGDVLTTMFNNNGKKP